MCEIGRDWSSVDREERVKQLPVPTNTKEILAVVRDLYISICTTTTTILFYSTVLGTTHSILKH